VLRSEPVNLCHSFKNCFWFTDHTKCLARQSILG
jgi:hypothetical protein